MDERKNLERWKWNLVEIYLVGSPSIGANLMGQHSLTLPLATLGEFIKWGYPHMLDPPKEKLMLDTSQYIGSKTLGKSMLDASQHATHGLKFQKTPSH